MEVHEFRLTAAGCERVQNDDAVRAALLACDATLEGACPPGDTATPLRRFAYHPNDRGAITMIVEFRLCLMDAFDVKGTGALAALVEER